MSYRMEQFEKFIRSGGPSFFSGDEAEKLKEIADYEKVPLHVLYILFLLFVKVSKN